jgi:hypothetical protein
MALPTLFVFGSICYGCVVLRNQRFFGFIVLNDVINNEVKFILCGIVQLLNIL